MFAPLFFGLKQAGVPVSLREYLTLLEAMQAGLPEADIDQFYYLARASLVKDERHFDRFDRVFAAVFRGLEAVGGEQGGGTEQAAELPAEWLRAMAEKLLSEEEKAQIESLGGFEALMDTLRQRLAEQRGRHLGGNKWIGTGGTSPFGAYGYNPEGVRIGQSESRHRRAVKVWDRRDFRDFDDRVELGTRGIKLALRRLRRFARSGAADELDLDATIAATAHNAGWLDVRMRPERHNAVKLLLFLDVGGSMDDHIRLCEQVFSAARSEFKHLEHYYFHNCVYESVWRDNARRHEDRIPLTDIMHTYGSDYRLIVVGDASMSPYEIAYAGASVEHFNEEAGEVWLRRLLSAFPKAVWLNPVPEAHWGYTQSIAMLSGLMEGRMFPLTLDGLDRAIQSLQR